MIEAGLTDEALAATWMARAVVEMETELQANWELRIVGPGGAGPFLVREAMVRGLALLYDAVERSGVTVDRSLAVGAWAPRR